MASTRRIGTAISGLGCAATLLCALVTGTGLMAQSAPAYREKEAVVRSITRWNAPWYEDCDGSKRTAWDDMAEAWYYEITNSSSAPGGHGSKAWRREGRYVNGNFVDSKLTDEGVVSWGDDGQTDNPDAVDAFMVALHGVKGSRWSGRVRVNEWGFGNCDSWQGHMRFGNSSDLEFLHMSSCHSMRKSSWSKWKDSFRGLHQADGFHGEMWISTGRIADYRDFADDAFSTSIADAWIQHLHDTNVKGTYDQCPVAFAVSSSYSDAWRRVNNERYDYVYSDPSGRSYYATIYVAGCDPKGDSAM